MYYVISYAPSSAVMTKKKKTQLEQYYDLDVGFKFRCHGYNIIRSLSACMLLYVSFFKYVQCVEIHSLNP